jgi:hypothetical protein
LLGKCSEAIQAIHLLKDLVEASHWLLFLYPLANLTKPETEAEVHAFIHDAERFLLNSRSIIEEAPLQIYASALVFAPQKSIIRNPFIKETPD